MFMSGNVLEQKEPLKESLKETRTGHKSVTVTAEFNPTEDLSLLRDSNFLTYK